MMEDKYYKTGKVYVAVFLNKRKQNPNVSLKVPIECSDEEDVDLNIIRNLCKTKFGDDIENEIVRNNNKDDILKQLKAFSETRAKDFDCFLFFFLGFIDDSQGATDSQTFKSDDGFLPIDEIYNSVKKSSDMAGKPKVFVFQAEDTRLLPTPYMDKSFLIEEEPQAKTKKIPTDADMLIITSTIPQLLANTNHERFQTYTGFDPKATTGVQPSDAVRGSFLIQAFVDFVLDESNRDVDILTLTTKINGKIEDLIEEVKKDERFRDEINQQILDKLELPFTTSTLTKLVVFKKLT
ncbi:uncharacterized protein LOC128218096 [Mya arenaria]|uniref:uncharacterized protein LOC128218096 n=1 Tax=Mya arenaria TaxID=6604 RepID=UPI0022E60AA0|nr:uncharacterized protein LOC128218096 [Mya arenaria]XP_052781604.1 uncharacterized protein LOC128218096 [Mya arenaria]